MGLHIVNMDSKRVQLNKETRPIFSEIEAKVTEQFPANITGDMGKDNEEVQFQAEHQELTGNAKAARRGLSAKVLRFIESIDGEAHGGFERQLCAIQVTLSQSAFLIRKAFSGFLYTFLADALEKKRTRGFSSKGSDQVAILVVQQDIKDPLVLLYEIFLRYVSLALDDNMCPNRDGEKIMSILKGVHTCALKNKDLISPDLLYDFDIEFGDWFRRVGKVVHSAKLLNANRFATQSACEYLHEVKNKLLLSTIYFLNPRGDGINEKLADSEFGGQHSARNILGSRLYEREKKLLSFSEPQPSLAVSLQYNKAHADKICHVLLSKHEFPRRRVEDIRWLYSALWKTNLIDSVVGCVDSLLDRLGWVPLLTGMLQPLELKVLLRAHYSDISTNFERLFAKKQMQTMCSSTVGQAFIRNGGRHLNDAEDKLRTAEGYLVALSQPELLDYVAEDIADNFNKLLRLQGLLKEFGGFYAGSCAIVKGNTSEKRVVTDGPFPAGGALPDRTSLPVQEVSRDASESTKNAQSVSFSPRKSGGHARNLMVRYRIPSGLRFEIIKANGHCFYNAVALYVGMEQQELRNLVVSRVQQGPDSEELKTFLLKRGVNIKLYLAGVQKNQWAGDIEIEVLMRALERPIVVIGKQGAIANESLIRGRFPNNAPIFVFYNGRDHYDALLLESGQDGKKILRNLQKQVTSNRESTHPGSDAPSAKAKKSTGGKVLRRREQPRPERPPECDTPLGKPKKLPGMKFFRRRKQSLLEYGALSSGSQSMTAQATQKSESTQGSFADQTRDKESGRLAGDAAKKELSDSSVNGRTHAVSQQSMLDDSEKGTTNSTTRATQKPESTQGFFSGGTGTQENERDVGDAAKEELADSSVNAHTPVASMQSALDNLDRLLNSTKI